MLTIDELVNHLRNVFKQKNIICDENSLYLIASQGAGSVRDTLSIADSVSAFCEKNITYDKCLEVLGLTSSEGITKLVNCIISNDVKGIFYEVKDILNRGKNISLLCKETAEYFKNLLLIQAGVTDLNTLNIMPNELDLMKAQATKIDSDILKLAFDRFARIELDLKYSVNPQNLFESVCVSLLNIAKRVTFASGTNSEQVVTTGSVVKNEVVKKIDTSSDGNINAGQKNISNMNGLEAANDGIDLLWGKVLLKIKEKNMFALSASLKDVYGVHMVGNCLVLQTNDQSVLKMIDDPSRLDVILNIATEMNDNIKKVEVKYDESNKSSKDIVAELKNIFMDKLKVKE